VERPGGRMTNRETASTAKKDAPDAKPSGFIALLLRVRRLSLRTRLVVAFVTLIVSSAAATIMIGTTVFGRKVDELGRLNVGLYIHLANQMFDMEMHRLRFKAYTLAQGTTDAEMPAQMAGAAKEGVQIDFAVRISDKGTIIFRRGTAPTSGVAGFEHAAVSDPDSATLRNGPFAPAIARVATAAGPVAGLVVAKAEELPALGLPSLGEDLLVAVSASRGRSSGEVLLLGRLLNRNTEMLKRIEALVNPRNPKEFGGTIFLGERRVASIIMGDVRGTPADPRVIQAVLREGRIYQGEALVVDRNFYASYAPLRDFDGQVVGMLGVGEGIGAEAYQEIRRATVERFATLIVGGMIFGFLMTFLFSQWLVRPIRALAAGMSRVAEGDLDHKVRIESADELGRLAHAFNRMVRGVKERDNRLREMTEDRLSAVEKQISIGRLAAGVAHEINNPLTAILSLSTLLKKKAIEGSPDREDLDIIVTETTRCREIVRSLLDFARERPTERRVVDIHEVIRETVGLVSRYGGVDQVQVSVEAASGPLSVNVDPKALQQVFTNLLVNAAEATGPGGRITIRVDEDSSGGFVQVQMRDNGKGIPREHLDRVFEPFFTTKGERKGTGLGLSVSLGIVRKHDGSIEIRSEEGKGTEVTVSLPRWDGE
jgi:two-component system, NtrC family, sensor kinase